MGINYEPMPTSWGERLIQLADSIGVDRQRSIENERQGKLTAAELAVRKQQERAAALANTESESQVAARQKLIDETKNIQGGLLPSPESEKDAAMEAEVSNWDKIHAAPDAASRRLIGKQVESSGAVSAEPDYGKLSMQASSRLSPLMVASGAKESDVPLLGTLKEQSSRQQLGEQFRQKREEEQVFKQEEGAINRGFRAGEAEKDRALRKEIAGNKSEHEGIADKILNRKDRIMGRIDQIMRSDQIIKKRKDQYMAAQDVAALLNSGNPVTDLNIGVQFARAAGESGAMTERDVNRWGGRQAVVSKINQAFKKWSTGKLTEENSALLKDVAGLMMKNSQSRHDEYLDKIASAQTHNYGLDYEKDIKPLVDIYKYGGKDEETQPTVSGSSTINLTGEKAKRLEELRRKAAEGTIR